VAAEFTQHKPIVDYCVRSILREKVCGTRFDDVNQLNCKFLCEWTFAEGILRMSGMLLFCGLWLHVKLEKNYVGPVPTFIHSFIHFILYNFINIHIYIITNIYIMRLSA